jgi:hypothetical protein
MTLCRKAGRILSNSQVLTIVQLHHNLRSTEVDKYKINILASVCLSVYFYPRLRWHRRFKGLFPPHFVALTPWIFMGSPWIILTDRKGWNHVLTTTAVNQTYLYTVLQILCVQNIFHACCLSELLQVSILC